MNTMKGVSRDDLDNMDLNPLLYLFIDSFLEIKTAMRWNTDQRNDSRARIHRDRAYSIIDSRNIISHPLPGQTVDHEMKLSVVLNVLLFIRAIKSQFTGESDKITYNDCESYLEGLLGQEKESGGNTAPAASGGHDGAAPDLKAVTENTERALQIALDSNDMVRRLIEMLDKNAEDAAHPAAEETRAAEADREWFLGISADAWFSFSQIAEENDLVNDRGKAMLYNMGRYRLNNWEPSVKQLSYAKSLHEIINDFLNQPTETEQVQGETE